MLVKWGMTGLGVVAAAVLAYYLVSWILTSVIVLGLVGMVGYLIFKRVTRR